MLKLVGDDVPSITFRSRMEDARLIAGLLQPKNHVAFGGRAGIAFGGHDDGERMFGGEGRRLVGQRARRGAP